MDELPKTYVDGKWVTLTRANVDHLIEEGEKAAQSEPQPSGTYDRRLTKQERRRFEDHQRGKSRAPAAASWVLRAFAWIVEGLIVFILMLVSCGLQR